MGLEIVCLRKYASSNSKLAFNSKYSYCNNSQGDNNRIFTVKKALLESASIYICIRCSTKLIHDIVTSTEVYTWL
jgi:hypothetical protein